MRSREYLSISFEREDMKQRGCPAIYCGVAWMGLKGVNEKNEKNAETIAIYNLYIQCRKPKIFLYDKC